MWTDGAKPRRPELHTASNGAKRYGKCMGCSAPCIRTLTSTTPPALRFGGLGSAPAGPPAVASVPAPSRFRAPAPASAPAPAAFPRPFAAAAPFAPAPPAAAAGGGGGGGAAAIRCAPRPFASCQRRCGKVLETTCSPTGAPPCRTAAARVSTAAAAMAPSAVAAASAAVYSNGSTTQARWWASALEL